MAEKKAARKTARNTGATRRRTARPAEPPEGDGASAASTEPAVEQLAEKASVLAVRSDESPWSKEELEPVYAGLRAEADRLRAEIEAAEAELVELLRDGGEGAGDDQADAGSMTFEREHEMSLAANARDLLEQTENALLRIKDGTYGTCEGCGRPIGKARLLAYPRATLCVACKQKEERR